MLKLAFLKGSDCPEDECGNEKEGRSQCNRLRDHLPGKLCSGVAKGGWAILHNWSRTLHPVLHLSCCRSSADRIAP